MVPNIDRNGNSMYRRDPEVNRRDLSDGQVRSRPGNLSPYNADAAPARQPMRKSMHGEIRILNRLRN